MSGRRLLSSTRDGDYGIMLVVVAKLGAFYESERSADRLLTSTRTEGLMVVVR